MYLSTVLYVYPIEIQGIEESSNYMLMRTGKDKYKNLDEINFKLRMKKKSYIELKQITFSTY